MIDEDLYQQAADELNSNKRRPHLWARACALASDDHDEARYLYTNLRVEELIAERAESEPANIPAAEADSTLALTPMAGETAERLTDSDGDGDGDGADILSEADLAGFSDDAPSSYTAPSGVVGPDSSDDFLQLEPMDDKPENNPAAATENPDPDADLMADYVPEGDSLEDTYADDGMVEEGFQTELENFKAEESTDDSPPDTSNVDTNALDSISPDVLEPSARESQTDVFEDQTTELTSAYLAGDLTQSNMDVLEAHTSELDDMLEEANYQPPDTEEPDTDMVWLEESSEPGDKPAIEHEPAVYEEDPFVEELNRQADELDVDAGTERMANASGDFADGVHADSAFAKANGLANDGATTAVAAGSAVLAATDDKPIMIPDDVDEYPNDFTGGIHKIGALDLTQGRKGTLFQVLDRHGETQAVKQGVSWSALFFTLPFLLYRKLFGTALAYSLLWIVCISGLVICALAWHDAGTAVTPFVQGGTIGFALLSVIGLLYLPFRYANTWRREKLEARGFEIVAITKAKNTDLAVARARRHGATPA